MTNGGLSYHDMRDRNIQYFIDVVSEQNWEEIEIAEGAENKYTAFEEILKSLFKQAFQIKRKRIEYSAKNHSKRFTSGIKNQGKRYKNYALILNLTANHPYKLN
jgi:ribosome-associated translation inhibitor RaiA